MDTHLLEDAVRVNLLNRAVRDLLGGGEASGRRHAAAERQGLVGRRHALAELIVHVWVLRHALLSSSAASET